jgi:hypothetical protein
MTAPLAFQRLTLRAVLRDVSPMVIRVVSVPDDTELTDLHEIFQAILGWSLDLGYSFRIHGKEFNSFRRRTRSQPLREFHLHRQEKFLYLADTLDLWALHGRAFQIGGYAALRMSSRSPSVLVRIPGYQRPKVAWSSPFSAFVRTCRGWCAPR